MPPTPELEPFYSQTIAWEDCGDLQCGTVTVPIDYRDPGGATIDLAVNKLAAPDPASVVGPLVVNPGGPGVPGTDYAEQAPLAFRAELLDRFDVIGFDPRGTGGSDPVDCLTDDELSDFIAADPDPDDAAEEEAFAAGQDAFFAGCVERSDSLIGHVTTIEAARDLDVIRAALGQTTLTYLGASYGTKLGATYAELFPKKVGRLVLDGAVDVSLPSRELSLAQAGGFETALRSYVDDCVAGRRLLPRRHPRRGHADDQRPDRRHRGAAAPDPAGPRADGRQRVLRPRRPALQPRQLVAARPGPEPGPRRRRLDAPAALGLLRLARGRHLRGQQRRGDPAPSTASTTPTRSTRARSRRSTPTSRASRRRSAGSSPGAWSAAAASRCSRPSRRWTIRGEGAAPIVVTGTTRDPATPYAWAVSLAEQLESGVLITRDGDGHTAYNAGNECVDEAIEAYLIEGTVPEDGLEC